MKTPSLISVPKLHAITEATFATTATIDNPNNLRASDQRAWLFTGTKDSVVANGVVEKLKQYYRGYLPANGAVTVDSIPSERERAGPRLSL